MFLLIESYPSSRRTWIVTNHSSSSKCAINSWLYQKSIFTHLFLNFRPDDVLCKYWYLTWWYCSQLSMYQNIWAAIRSWDRLWAVTWSQKRNFLETISTFHQLAFYLKSPVQAQTLEVAIQNWSRKISFKDLKFLVECLWNITKNALWKKTFTTFNQVCSFQIS